jgi:hypothetical protein
MKRFWIAVLMAATLFISALPIANAVVTPGSKCTKAGVKQTYKGKVYTCIKIRNTLVWNKGVIQVTPSPTIKNSPTPTPSPSIQNLQIVNDPGSSNLTRIQIDSSRRVGVGCNGSQMQDSALIGRLLLAFSTHNVISKSSHFLNANYNPKSWVGTKPNFLNGILPYIEFTASNNSSICTYTSTPIPNLVKEIATDIQSIGLFYEPTGSPGRLTHLGSILVNRVAAKGVLEMMWEKIDGTAWGYLPRVWCLFDDPTGVIGFSPPTPPVLLDNQMKEYKKSPQWHGMSAFASQFNKPPFIPEDFYKHFNSPSSSRAWGFYYDFSSAELFLLQGTTVNCKFTGRNIFGDVFTILEAMQIPKELVSVKKDFVAKASFNRYEADPSWGDEWVESSISCEVRSYSGYQPENSFVSVLDPLGNQLVRVRFSGSPRFNGVSTAEGASYSVKIDEMIKNSDKTYYCFFDLTGVDGSKVTEKLPAKVPSIIKSPLPKPQTVVQSVGRGGDGEVGCFLTNWQDYSLGSFKKVNSSSSVFEPNSKVTLLRDDGSIVTTSGFSWKHNRDGSGFWYLTLDKRKYYVGLLFDTYDFARERERADGKRYTCKYEMVGFTGEKLVHTEIVQMPFKK